VPDRSGNSIVFGTAVLLLARLVPPAASFGVFYLAVLHWGPETWGLFHILLSVYTVLQLIGGLGVDLLVLQKASAQPDELPRLIRAVAGLLGRVGVVLGGVMAMMTWVIWADTDTRLAGIFFGGAIPAAALTPTLEASWISMGRPQRVGAVVLLEHGIRLLASFAALKIGGGPAALAFVLFLSKWLGTVLLTAPLWKFQLGSDGMSLSSLIRSASPFALFFVVAAVLHRMDSLVVAAVRPLAEVGYYGAAVRIVLLPTVASQAFGVALHPHLAHLVTLATGSSADIRQLGKAGLASLGALSFIPAIVLVSFPTPLLSLIGMNAYLAAAPLLAILAFMLPALFSIEVLFRCLISQGRLRSCLRIVLTQAILGFGTLVLATHLYGLRGAAAASVAIAWIGAAAYLITLERIGISLWRSWSIVLLVGGASTVLVATLAPVQPGFALLLLGIYTGGTLALTTMPSEGSPSIFKLLTSSRGPSRF
jgi:O-antigen/teichoic acid export membrane protein